MKVDLIINNAAQLITCASEGKPRRGAAMREIGMIENGALAINDGSIVGVGKSSEISRDFTSETVFDARNKVVCPAFVEPHTHIVFAGDRLNEFELKIKGADYLEILENGGGILSTVRQTRAANLENLVEQTVKRLDRLLALGVTTCEVKTGYGLDTQTELKMLEAIFESNKIHTIDLIPTFLAAHAVPPEFKDNSDKYVNLICDEMLPLVDSRFKIPDSRFRIQDSEFRIRDSENPFFVDVFCEKGAFNLGQSRRVLETAKNLGFKLKAHVDEFTNLGGARLAIELGATSIDHLDAISDAEINLLAASDTIGIVTPTVNFNFGSAHFADARKMIDANCAIAVSTDYNPGSAPCPSPPLAMAIACRYQKLLPAEVLSAATINAAFAVASGDSIGSLEVGKQADFLIFDTNDYRQIAYEFGANLIEKVFKSGRLVSGN
jgi:imidazolonepropionase